MMPRREAGFSLKPRLEIDTLSAICEVVATTNLMTILPGIVLHSTLAPPESRPGDYAIRRSFAP